MGSDIVEIESIVRPMWGGSQSYLVVGQDKRFYVAKFVGNPQGTRTLINEWITSSLFQQFSICTPPVQVLRLSEQLRDRAQLYFLMGSRRVSIAPGLHFGSACPVDPTKRAIFDFLPRKLLHQVVNLGDFAKALVIDKLLGQTDRRQAIFVRQRGLRAGAIAFRAYLIDHGLVFGGDRWELEDSPLHGLYADREIYSLVDTELLCEETLDQMDRLTREDLNGTIRGIPSSWLTACDHQALTKLLSFVYLRKTGLRRLLAQHSFSLNSGPRRNPSPSAVA